MPNHMRAIIRELFETVILALLIFLALQFSVQNYTVQGSSMRPTLEEGEYVLVNKLVYLRFNPNELVSALPFIDIAEDQVMFPFHPPRRGEVVIFHFPRDKSRDFVKRVVGIPGDTVEIRKGQVYVNGTPRDEPYITRPGVGSLAETTVPEGTFFVLGDNRAASNDSRDWGPVPFDDIVGRAWVSFWPLNRWQALSAVPGF